MRRSRRSMLSIELGRRNHSKVPENFGCRRIGQQSHTPPKWLCDNPPRILTVGHLLPAAMVQPVGPRHVSNSESEYDTCSISNTSIIQLLRLAPSDYFTKCVSTIRSAEPTSQRSSCACSMECSLGSISPAFQCFTVTTMNTFHQSTWSPDVNTALSIVIGERTPKLLPYLITLGHDFFG